MGLRYSRTLVDLIEDAALRDNIGMARIGLNTDGAKAVACIPSRPHQLECFVKICSTCKGDRARIAREA